jgi:hypothetical protein
MARPPKPDSEQLVSVSFRMPRDLYDEAQDRARLRRTTMTALLLEGLRLCLDTPIDPREVPASQSNTAMQELEQLIDARVYAILAREQQREPAPQPGQSMTGLSSDARKTVIQVQEVGESTQDGHAVMRGQDAEDLGYDPTRYVLGKLCPQGHEHGTTGMSLRRLPGRGCRECENEGKRRRRQKH